MSEVASLELCCELYELSHWQDVEQYWEEYTMTGDYILKKSAVGNPFPKDKILSPLITPAYGAGYLLRKLPIGHPKTDMYARLIVQRHYKDKWSCFWATEDDECEIYVDARTPEDATAKLCIELFKRGILKREGESK